MTQDDFERKLTKAELRLARKLRAEINRAIDEVSEALTVELYQQMQHEQNIRELLSIEQTATIQTFASIQAAELGLELASQSVERIQFEYLEQFALNHSRLIADTTFKKLRQALLTSLASGDTSPRKVAKDILAVTKLTKPRALMIARTESHNAAVYAQFQVSKEYEEYYGERLYKRWSPTRDKRVRDTHKRMSSHPVIPLNQAFRVGGSQMLMPGDSSLGAPASEIINCRCNLRYYRESELKDIK